ncbi:MAG: TonB-dependent receptor plug domain-containing protein [Erythrobacter sp.]|nr:TonB-dependent receptor plug domain-containing protein [Erythrobacter sp.]
MKYRHTGRARAGLAATVALSALVVASPAFAQDEDVSIAGEVEEEQQSVITVTGSRIRNPAAENLEPTTFIDESFLEQRNFINAADALNDLPLIRGSVTPDGNQGESGVGVNFINIFGLGSQRSLTLINGRRVVSSNSPANAGLANPGVQVDLNIIPTALIERVDVVSICQCLSLC